jgi:DNA repair exonuclease SbcCD ATPase subunit
MKISKVKLQNFKGWSSLEHEFDTSNKTILYGKSGSGKTSILEAFKFVLGLTVKDPYPQMKDKETGGMSFIRDLEVVVEFELERNGIKYTLKRIASQKYKTNKETGEKEWAGWEANDFEFDGVKMNGTLYKEKIAEFIGVEKYEYIEFLVDPFYFNTDNAQKWTWKNRQQILYKLMNVDSALESLKNDEKFALIKEHIEKGRTTTEILKILNTERKSINEEKEKAEILLNEKTNELNTYKDIDFAALEKEKAELEKNIETETQLLSVQTSQSVELEIKKQIAELQNAITKHNIDYNNARNTATNELQKHKNILENIKVVISRDESELVRNSKEWKELNGTEWKGDTICNTCKRPLEEHLVAEAKAHFEKDRQEKLEKYKNAILALRDNLAKNKDLYTAKLTEINSLEDKILNIKPSEEIATLEKQISELQARLGALSNNSNVDYTKLNRLKEELREVNEKMAFRLVKEMTEKRISELKNQQIELTNKEIVNAKTRRVFEEYTLSIIDKVNDTVNSGFDGISWLLFDTHTASAENSISETCELIYNNTPYSALSSGEKVQANFLTIKGLQDNFNVSLPIFVDEVAISTGFERIANQQIIELKTTDGFDTNLKGVKIKDVYGE